MMGLAKVEFFIKAGGELIDLNPDNVLMVIPLNTDGLFFCSFLDQTFQSTLIFGNFFSS
ncbi:hypothetical protein NLC35_01975 [Candidatus Aminicenantes bacterium AC-334-K16]|jgi:hypothetical protein|nr:hypothetical protein [Candidatus Aminicenantes bacterium AC-334-K16]